MKVTVIIPARDAGSSIDACIRSAANQTLSDIEIIVVDDGSLDQTPEIIKRWSDVDGRVKFFWHPNSRGVSAARNTAIRAAKGEWLAVLDADDEFYPNRLDIMVQEGEARKLDIIIDNLDVIDYVKGESLGVAFPPDWMSLSRPLPKNYLIERDLPYRQKMGFGFCKPVFKRQSFLAQIGGYDERLKCSEDVVALQMALFNGAQVGVINYAGYLYNRQLHSSSSRRHANADISRANRTLALVAEARHPETKALLKARQIMIDYDGLIRSLKMNDFAASICFIVGLPPAVLCTQIFRVLVRRLGFDVGLVHPTSPRWHIPSADSRLSSSSIGERRALRI